MTLNHTVSVTIGRNSQTGGVMPAKKWGRFEQSIINILEHFCAEKSDDFVEVHKGTSEWDGMAEDSIKITGLYEYDLSVADKRALRIILSAYAKTYHQEAIALSFGTNELIYGTEE